MAVTKVSFNLESCVFAMPLQETWSSKCATEWHLEATTTFMPDFFVRDGRSKDPSASEITELLTKRTNPYSTQAPAKRKLARTLKRGLGSIVASSSLKELLARLSAILGVSLLADNAASL